MPRAFEYLNDSPQGLLRQIILIQISIAFLAVFLIIATAKPNQYRSKTGSPASFSTLDTNPYTIFTASDHVPSLLAFVYSISLGNIRSNIILFTSHEQTAIEVRADLLLLTSGNNPQQYTIVVISDWVFKDHGPSLWKAALAESKDDVVVWVDPGVTVASAHLLAQLPRLVHQEGGRWAKCTSETVCTIVGLNTTATVSFYRNLP